MLASCNSIAFWLELRLFISFNEIMLDIQCHCYTMLFCDPLQSDVCNVNFSQTIVFMRVNANVIVTPILL